MATIPHGGTFQEDPYYSTHPDDLDRAARLVRAVKKPHWTEAPCSVNVRLPIDGHDVQLTLRGDDEAQVLSRLHAVLVQMKPPQGESAQSNGERAKTNGERPDFPLSTSHFPLDERPDWCGIHGAAMAQQRNAHGHWYSHKAADGWCNGKRRKTSA